ncbi:MAG: hypothetical protein RR483_06780, partial [Clostridia bacterium]
VIDYNKGEYTTYIDFDESNSIMMPLPKWTKVETSLYKYIMNVKSYLKQEEIEKFYNDVFYSKAKKIVKNDDPSYIAYCDMDKKLYIKEIIYRTDEKFTFYQIYYGRYLENYYKII